jgi:ribonuclease PH
MNKRNGGRKPDELRPVFFGQGFAKNAAGSCFVKLGDTHVICAASIEDRVPQFLRNTGSGWITAEYGMLPCSTNERTEREAVKGKQSGRTQEIQRLIARSLRATIDLKLLGERQIKIDCDVVQADGGTRTASITGGYIAMYNAIRSLLKRRVLAKDPIIHQVAAISCGIVNGEPLLDLDYSEDSVAEADANFVMDWNGNIVEIQATAEKAPFPRSEMDKLIDLAGNGIKKLIESQRECCKSV